MVFRTVCFENGKSLFSVTVRMFSGLLGISCGGRGDYPFLLSSQLWYGFVPSENTFEISSSLRSVSWRGFLMTSFSVGLVHVSFVYLTRVPSMTGHTRSQGEFEGFVGTPLWKLINTINFNNSTFCLNCDYQSPSWCKIWWKSLKTGLFESLNEVSGNC